MEIQSPVWRFDAALLGMGVCLVAGLLAGFWSALPLYVASSHAAVAAAALGIAVTLHEF